MIKLRYSLIISIILLLFGIYGLGRNGQTAQRLATDVVSADNGNQPLDRPQQILTNYVHGHMGSSVTVFLAGSYERARVAATPNSDGQVYQAAQQACVSKTSAVNQAKCVQDYVASHATTGSSSAQAPQLDRASYTQTYTAPRWTPDLAGLSLLGALVGLVVSLSLWLRRR